MDGDRSFGKAIADDKLTAVMGALYNTWFKKWKKVQMTDETFDKALDEVWEIMMQNGEYPVVGHMAIALLYELDARMHGGYTETTRDKLFQVIRSEYDRHGKKVAEK